MSNLLSKLTSIVSKPAKRKGRGLGSGRGAKSGRGTTRHQKARENIPLHFEGGQGRIVKKYPLLRGKGRNRSKKNVVIIFTRDLNQFKEGETVDLKTLKEKGIVDKNCLSIKVINKGKLEKKIMLKLPVSQSVKQAVEKLGGSVM